MIKTFSLLFITLLLTSSCSQKIKVESIPLNTINNQLSLEWLATETSPITGFYTTDNNNILNGPFSIKSVTQNDHISNNSISLFSLNIDGSYAKGQKTGEWRYDYEYDDGGILYEKYTITPHYLKGECQQSVFHGVIGRDMPLLKRSFNDKTFCNPMQLREEIMDIWDHEQSIQPSGTPSIQQ